MVGTSTAPFAGTLRRANRRSRVPSRPTPLPAPTMASACPQERTQERRPAWQARWRRPTPRAMTDPRPASRSWQGPSYWREGPRPAAASSRRPASKAMRMTKRTERTSFSWLSKSSTVLHGCLDADLPQLAQLDRVAAVRRSAVLYSRRGGRPADAVAKAVRPATRAGPSAAGAGCACRWRRKWHSSAPARSPAPPARRRRRAARRTTPTG